jgi:GNAT superfamily N-acetyltransferase
VDSAGQAIEYRAMTPPDLAAVAALLREGLQLPEFSADYLRWKCYANPAGDADYWLAVQDGRVVAAYGAIPYLATARGEDSRVWFTTDGFVAPHLRRRGLYSRLLELTRQSLIARGDRSAFCTASRMSRPAFEKTGYYRCVPAVSYFWTALGQHRGVGRTAGSRSWKQRAAGRLSELTGGRRRCLQAAAAAEAQELDWATPPDELESLVRATAPANSICLARTPAFCRWRFGRHPWRQYRGWLLREGGAPVGHVIVRGANVVDIRGRDDQATWRTLIGLALQALADAGESEAHVYSSGPPGLATALRRAGFLQWDRAWRPRGLYPPQTLMVAKLAAAEPEFPDVWNPASWTLQMADLDCGL